MYIARLKSSFNVLQIYVDPVPAAIKGINMMLSKIIFCCVIVIIFRNYWGNDIKKKGQISY